MDHNDVGRRSILYVTTMCRYGVAFWYAGKLVREDNSDYTAGRVMNVIFGAIIAGFSLGQAAPSFGAFATGTCTLYSRLNTGFYTHELLVTNIYLVSCRVLF